MSNKKSGHPPKVLPRPKTTFQFPALTERPQSVTKYLEQSAPMRLGDAVVYYNPSPANAFLVSDGSYNPKECIGVTKGDLFAVCMVKKEPVLQMVTEDSVRGLQQMMSVPVKTSCEFSFLPSDEGNFSAANQPIRSWERKFECVEELLKLRESQIIPIPSALKVVNNALDHNKKQVPADTILFNIRQVSQRVGLRKRQGIEGEDSSGTVHCFLEGEVPLHFSTKLFDVKCSPMYFANVLQFPQRAVVYLHPEMGEEQKMKSLQHLSTVTITDLSYDQHLVVRKLSDSDCQQKGTSGRESVSYLNIPFNAPIEVVGVTLKDSEVMDQILANRQHTTDSVGPQSPVGMNHYLGEVRETAVEEHVEEEAVVEQEVVDRRRSNPKQRSQSAYTAEERHYQPFEVEREKNLREPAQYYNLPLKEERRTYENFKVFSSSDDNNTDDGRETSPEDSTEDQYLTMKPTSAKELGDSFEYDYVDSIRMTGSVLHSVVYPKGNPRHPPQHRRTTVIPRVSPSAPEDYRMHMACIAESDSKPRPSRSKPAKTKGKSSKMRSSSQPRSISDKVTPPLMPQASPSAPGDYRMHMARIAGTVADSEPLPSRSKPVKTHGKSSRVRSSSQPRSASDKVAPPMHGLALPFPHEAPVLRHVNTREMGGVGIGGRHCVAQEPASGPGSLKARPRESQLLFHVASKLGKDWRSVGTYLGLQYYQLDQADVARSELEDKAMDTLVMWLSGKGESKAPRSWKTVLKALRNAGRVDMASDLEKDILEGRLLTSEQNSPTRQSARRV